MGITIKYNDALRITSEILIKAGFKEEYANEVADNLVSAEGRGVYSHGLVQVAPYVSLFQNGKIKNTTPEIVKDFGAVANIDGKFAPGAVAGNIGMDLAIEKAKKYGVGIVTVHNGAHFGMAYHYAKRAVENNMIGFAYTSAGFLVAPYGGRTRQVGTNPICIASPAKNRMPIVFDAATSVQAFNKIYFASVENREIPIGWAIDKNGNDTTDPNEAMEGCLLPFGGYKGYGLGFMIQIITAILSGTRMRPDQERQMSDPHSSGYHFMAIDIARFVDFDQFTDEVSYYADNVVHSERRPGVDRIYLPGEIEFEKEAKAKAEGIDLPDGVWGKLIELCNKYQINYE